MKLQTLALSLCLFLAVLSVFAQNTGSISGTVREGNGNPVTGATVTLTSSESSRLQTLSGSDGSYRFDGVAPGDYTLAAALDGYSPKTLPATHIPSTGAPLAVDLVLNRTTSPPSPAKPKLQLEASGIHGLIDPGGYSASASADAATGLLRGIAQVKREDAKRGDASLAMALAKDWPCARAVGLRQQLAGHPQSQEANRNLGQFYVAHNQPSKAIPLLKQALAIDGKDDDVAKALAIAWLEQGEFEEARKLLTQLAERVDGLGPGQPELHRLLAHADEGAGLFEQAAQQYRIAYREQPSEVSRFGEAYELLLAGSPSDASIAFAAGEHEYPKSIQLKIGSGTAQFLLSHFSQSVHSFLDATDIDPSDPRPYPFLAAAASLSSDEKPRVLAAFKRYLDRAPLSAAANLHYASALARASSGTDTAYIETLLHRAIQLDPLLVKAHLQLADIYAQRKEYESAIAEYESAIGLAPSLGEAHYRLALALKRTGHLDQSAAEMQVFQQSKQPSGSASDTIDLAQFISVMDTSAQNSNLELDCAEPQ